jgi:hypothetical protein
MKQRSAAVGAGGDVKEHHLVRALVVVTHRKLDRVPDVAQAAALGPAELHTASDLSVMDIKTGNDTPG